MDCVKESSNVLLVWGSSSPPSDMESYVTSLKETVGENGKVQVEHSMMLLKSGHNNATFDVVLSGTISNNSVYLHSDDVLAEILKVLKPNGWCQLAEPKGERSLDKLQTALTLTGYTNIAEKNSTDTILQVTCQKPNFEVGKSSKLSFVKKNTKSDVASIWTLSANDANDEEVDIIDSDALLDADDLKRPDLSGIITDCGTSKAGKRKACKGCTCGLKEELEGIPAPQEKSACGSCYLGDAFRCASCPYLGMPPFKPGDQVTLSERQLKPDI